VDVFYVGWWQVATPVIHNFVLAGYYPNGISFFDCFGMYLFVLASTVSQNSHSPGAWALILFLVQICCSMDTITYNFGDQS
jgi:hypothetical protein